MGSPERFLEALKGSLKSWDSQRQGILWLAGWASLVGLARWEARRASKTWYDILYMEALKVAYEKTVGVGARMDNILTRIRLT